MNPDYAPKDATFDFPIHLSLADKLAAVELVVWDKDMLKKDYLGEASITLEEWFDGRALGFADAENEPFSTDLTSTRENTPPTGSIRVKLGFVEPPNTQSLMSFEDVYSELVKRSRPSVMSAPPVRPPPSLHLRRAYVSRADRWHWHYALAPDWTRI